MNKKLKILIGTPIHEVKDYSMERWLDNVSRLKYPADLLMVDNSIATNYVEKVKAYCKKYGVKNYELKHLEFDPEMVPDERIERSEEFIRQEVLAGNYDAWFSWECDQIIPEDALDKLVKLMNSGDFTVVNCNSWSRKHPDQTNTDLGCVLVKKECLKKTGFLNNGHRFTGDDAWFKARAVKNGNNILEAYGVITPIYHLDG